MANQWMSSVRQTHRLNFYLNSIAGTWLTAVHEAIKEFNGLSTSDKLGVTYSPTATAPSNNGGADVSIATGNGPVSVTYSGTQITITINGRGLEGYTQLVSTQGGPVEKAFILLPNQPMISTPSGQRPIGLGVMKVIAFHELIHGCGLENRDHTDVDVFNGNPQPDYGSTPAQDRVYITVGRHKLFMPPIIFSAITAGKIARLWAS